MDKGFVWASTFGPYSSAYDNPRITGSGSWSNHNDFRTNYEADGTTCKTDQWLDVKPEPGGPDENRLFWVNLMGNKKRGDGQTDVAYIPKVKIWYFNIIA